MKIKILTIISCMLLMPFIVQTQVKQNKWEVIGRAVDDFGRPVGRARILVFSKRIRDLSQPDQIMTVEEADADGKFSYASDNTSLVVDSTSTLYVTSPLLEGTISLTNLVPPFSPQIEFNSIEFRGQPVHIKSGIRTNIGDVKVQVKYQIVLVHLKDRMGKPMLTDLEDWNYVGVRIRDKSGRRVEEFEITPISAKKAFRIEKSAVAIALPEGQWFVDIAPDGEGGKWIKSNILKIHASETPTQVTLISR